MTLAAAVHVRGTCEWVSKPAIPRFAVRTKCATRLSRVARIPKNSTHSTRRYTFVLAVAFGRRHYAAETSVAEQDIPTPPASTTTTTTAPPTTTTTLPPQCLVGNCTKTFPAVDTNGATALQVQAVTTNVSCPDPGVCDATASQQIDAVSVDLAVGSAGMTDPGAEGPNFSLTLPGGSQATLDSVTYDSSVANALGGLGPEGAGQRFPAVIYFDAPIGTAWTAVNFSYTSANFSTQAVYTWSAP